MMSSLRWIDWCLDCDGIPDSPFCDYHNATRAVVIIDDEAHRAAFGTPSPLKQLEQEL